MRDGTNDTSLRPRDSRARGPPARASGALAAAGTRALGQRCPKPDRERSASPSTPRGLRSRTPSRDPEIALDGRGPRLRPRRGPLSSIRRRTRRDPAQCECSHRRRGPVAGGSEARWNPRPRRPSDPGRGHRDRRDPLHDRRPHPARPRRGDRPPVAGEGDQPSGDPRAFRPARDRGDPRAPAAAAERGPSERRSPTSIPYKPEPATSSRKPSFMPADAPHSPSQR